MVGGGAGAQFGAARRGPAAGRPWGGAAHGARRAQVGLKSFGSECRGRPEAGPQLRASDRPSDRWKAKGGAGACMI